MALKGGIRSAVRSALAIVSSLTLLAGVIGWIGVSITEARLKEHQVQSLADVAQITSLVGRSVSLATEATKIGYFDTQDSLEAARVEFDEQMQEFLSLAVELPRPVSTDAFRLSDVPAIVRLVLRLDGMTQNLFAVTKEAVIVQQRTDNHRRTLERQLDLSSDRDESLAALRIVDRMSREEDLRQVLELRRWFEENISSSAISNQVISEMFDLRVAQISAAKRAELTMVMIDIAFTQLTATVESLSAVVRASAVQRGDELLTMTQWLKLAMLLGALLCLVAGLLVSAFFTRTVLRSLVSATEALRSLANGDSRSELPGEDRSDEIGDLARAFRVFKANAGERDELARQLEQDALLRLSILNALEEGVALFDAHGQLLAWNPRFVTLSGLKPEDAAIGLNDLGELLGVSMTQISAVGELSIEHFFPGGRTIEARIGAMPSNGALVTLVDLTERKEMERRLMQSQQMEAIGRLTGGIAHDFNNLLAAISSNLQLLQEQADGDSSTNKRVGRALRAVESGTSMVHRLLAFARQQPLQPEPASLNEIVRGLLDLVELSLDPSIKLKTRLTSAATYVVIDPGQLEAAVLNLVFNARDAMPAGGTLTISTRIGAGGKVEMMIADTGEGMSPEIAQKAFDPFFTTKAFGAGNGLGLSTVYGFIQQSGGDVSIESEVGGGTRMRIELPLAQTAESRRRRPLRRPVRGPHGQGRILLVEDDEVLCETTVDMLSSLGYEVTAVASAAAAMARLKRQTFDILFSDIMLGPKDDGRILAKKAQGLHPGLAVLLCTGYANWEQEGDGFSGYAILNKPYSKAELASALIEVRQDETVSTSAENV